MKNKTSGIKGSLTKKLGPLPAWAWGLVALVGVWWYRNKTSGTVSGTGTGSVGPAATTPQAQTTLQPGESVYDPNTGTLTTAPGGGSTTGGDTPGGLSSADINNLISAIEAGHQATSPPTAPTPVPSTPANTIKKSNRPPQRAGFTIKGLGNGKWAYVPKPKLPNGGIWAPSGPKKPPARKGYTIKGLGSGQWEYIPAGGKRDPKAKSQHGGTPAQNTRAVKQNEKAQTRSTASIKAAAKGKAKTIKAATPTRLRGGAKPAASAPRILSNRRVTPITSAPQVRQRPIATATPKARPKPVANSHRTASTPTRTVRTPAKKTVKKR